MTDDRDKDLIDNDNSKTDHRWCEKGIFMLIWILVTSLIYLRFFYFKTMAISSIIPLNLAWVLAQAADSYIESFVHWLDHSFWSCDGYRTMLLLSDSPYKNAQQDPHDPLLQRGKNPIRLKSQLKQDIDFRNTSPTCLAAKLASPLKALYVWIIASVICVWCVRHHTSIYVI